MRLLRVLLGLAGIRLGHCGGCGDEDCMDCIIEWGDCR